MSKRFYTPAGSPIYKKWKEDNDHKLVDVGTRNIQDEIDEFGDSMTVYNLIDRYVKGDTSAIRPASQALYADTTKMPKNIHEVKKMTDQAFSNYDKLPNEIKQQFDNDPKIFADANSVKLKDVIESYVNDVISRQKPVVKKDVGGSDNE